MSIITRVLKTLLFVPISFLVLATAYSVFQRYWAETPVHWMEEASGIALVWIVMIGAIAAEKDGDQLSIPLMVDMMSDRWRRLVEIFIGTLSVGLLLTLGYFGWTLANKVAFKLTGVLKISWFWIDIALPVGFAGMILCYLWRGRKSLRAREGASQ
ncbi:TRAP-type C4-dicarboxylate transport system, small permease component [Hoeflea sp. IMCC20628]|uniref:TRAP transporter small permease n=1 Tax=Hoeflea sp. IMCC20628 TaxID=1620421 RepID=UPI00063AE109|nr:TRAP transporter small permease [Hoeflea sp. IMCC20628]AKH99678.1 TRAP-type C4-dicarboxylate transport system, small permease component [Hoeflea sp. IMCC20628]